ncbi:DUF2177 family protein [Candidatus Nomurabacteria bacterium]|nr:DUF2177 family protein [Candidatus Nomurabacteria bacterium]
MFLKLYLIALPVLVVLDMTWLGLVAKNFYAKHIGFLLRPDFNLLPGIIFYLLYLVGLVFFIIMPAVGKGSWVYALLLGALFGLIAYSTYDLTNQATLKDWPLIVTVVDLAWGMVAASFISVVVYLIAKKIGM